MQLHFTYSPWWIIAIIIVAVVSVWLLYRRKTQKTYSVWQQVLLGSLRFLALFILGIGLLKPYFAYDKKHIQKPYIAVLQDVSASMQGQDSLTNTQQLQAVSQRLKEDINTNFELQMLPFDYQPLSPTDSLALEGEGTDIGQALQYTFQKYSLHNLQAVVLLTDGQHNIGQSPVAIAQQYVTPVFSVAFGDTIPQTGIKLQNLFYNEHSRQNSRFPVEVEAQAIGLKGATVEAALYFENKKIAHSTHKITQDKAAIAARFMVEATKAGLQTYKLQLQPVFQTAQDIETVTQGFFIDIAPSTQKILVLGHHPHPDLNAIATALRHQEGRQVEVRTLSSQTTKDLSQYNLVVLHGLPSTDQASNKLFQHPHWRQTALWVITTPSTYFGALNKLQKSWKSPDYIKNFTALKGKAVADFGLFHLPEAFNPQTWPALWYPQARITALRQDYPLLVAADKEQNIPLISFAYQGQQKLSLWQGYGLWQWRLHDYKTHESHQVFNTLINKTADFLLSGHGNELFQLQHRLIYEPNESIMWEARLMNPNLEPVSDAQIEIELSDSQGKTYTYAFSPKGKGSYGLDLSHLKPDAYSYKATATGKTDSKALSGHFAINKSNKEQQNTEANLPLLRNLAQVSGGQVFFPHQTANLLEVLNHQQNIKPTYQYLEHITQWIDLYWFLIIALLSLSIEWLLRRFWGGY